MASGLVSVVLIASLMNLTIAKYITFAFAGSTAIVIEAHQKTEVLALGAAARPNPEIAEKISATISKRT
jgi:hypothetical protein